MRSPVRASARPAAPCFLAALLVLMGCLDRVIFQPSRGVDLEPASLGIDAEEVFLRAEDGVRLHAFYLPARAASRGVLFLHGNAGNASHRLPNAAQIAGLGAGVLLLDYRGYGRSEGRPDEAGVYADARAGLRHLVEARGFSQRRTVVFGRSLGGAVAVDLAQGLPLAGLVLESTFTSAADLARDLTGLPVGFLVGRRFAPVEKIRHVRAPILFFHGDRDEIVPYELGRRLFEAAPRPKFFETIHGARHNDTVQVGGAAYFARLGRFLNEVAPAGDP